MLPSDAPSGKLSNPQGVQSFSIVLLVKNGMTKPNQPNFMVFKHYFAILNEPKSFKWGTGE